MKSYTSKNGNITITNADSLGMYDDWGRPVIIISDGPYGIGGFPGDPPTPEGLGEWYEPHIKKWSEKATPQTTLWFWGTEIGWATVHPILKKYGWKYISPHVWDKGIEHVAGNANTKTLRKLPVVTELCVQYVKQPIFRVADKELSIKEWLRHEWERTGLPFSKTNEASGVKDAATRKYFTKCHLWYFPPPEALEKFSLYANLHGDKEGRPYFSLDGIKPIAKKEWEKMRAKFHCPFGVTNVWQEPPLNGKERVKIGFKALHLNQKPLKFMKLIIDISSDLGDLIWEPFGGLCSAAVAAHETNRRCVCAEVNKHIYNAAVSRFKDIERQLILIPR